MIKQVFLTLAVIIEFVCVSIMTTIYVYGEQVSIVRIIDGDTVEVEKEDGERSKVRLSNIDAPETDQDYGEESKSELKSILENKKIEMSNDGREFYGRELGTFYMDGLDVNLEMVENGAAWAYRKSAPLNYHKAQERAKRKKIGLWKSRSPIPPWEWRKSH